MFVLALLAISYVTVPAAAVQHAHGAVELKATRKERRDGRAQEVRRMDDERTANGSNCLRHERIGFSNTAAGRRMATRSKLQFAKELGRLTCQRPLKLIFC